MAETPSGPFLDRVGFSMQILSRGRGQFNRQLSCSGPYLSYSTIPFLGTFWGPFKIILNYHLASSKDNVDLRNGGGTLVLSGSTTKTESSELCVGPGHAGVLTAESSTSNTGIYFLFLPSRSSVFSSRELS